MTNKQIKILHTVYGVTLSFMIVAVGIFFVGCCIGINESGAFTVEAIKTSFFALLFPSMLLVAAIIGGAILHMVFPAQEEKIEANISDKTVLKNLYKRIELKTSPKTYKRVVKSQRRFRHAFLGVVIFNCLLNATCALITIFGSDVIKTADAEDLSVMIPALATVLSYAVLPFFSVIIYKIFASFTYEKELEAASAIVKHNASHKIVVTKKVAKNGKKTAKKVIKKILVTALRAFVLVTAITFIVIGIVRGDLGDVLTIAKTICKGCIGIG